MWRIHSSVSNLYGAHPSHACASSLCIFAKILTIDPPPSCLFRSGIWDTINMSIEVYYLWNVTKFCVIKDQIQPLVPIFDRFIDVEVFHSNYIWMPSLRGNHKEPVNISFSHIVFLKYNSFLSVFFLWRCYRQWWLICCLIFVLIHATNHDSRRLLI